MSVVDWGTGSYEQIAAELSPAARGLVARAAPASGERVVDIACGTGNAALLAAERGARVTGVDRAERLLEVARETARAQGLSDVEFVAGDLEALPLADGVADLAVSVFGIIFAADPSRALGEAARILRGDGRLWLSAWIPTGPIDAMLGVVGGAVGRITNVAPPARFAWSDGAALEPVAAAAGLTLVASTPCELEIRATSPEQYVADGERFHPMSLATRPLLERAGVAEQTRERMIAVLREANEDPAAFLVHSPYVIHELRRAG